VRGLKGEASPADVKSVQVASILAETAVLTDASEWMQSLNWIEPLLR
jgi:hypothetical protein